LFDLYRDLSLLPLIVESMVFLILTDLTKGRIRQGRSKDRSCKTKDGFYQK